MLQNYRFYAYRVSRSAKRYGRLGEKFLSQRRTPETRGAHEAKKNTFFAFLRPCEIAKGDKDQIVQLAVVMLFASFRSVVVTMCVVSSLFKLMDDGNWS
jgi:hypothetical protein